MNLVENYPILKNRPYQIETIKNILQAFENKKYVLLDAPTGSGKTVMSLVISDIYWKYYNELSHIAVRTSEQIKRYLEDSKKIKTIIKVFPNKRKTCPIFLKTNLTGEEIICKDCPLREKTYTYKELFSKLEEKNYDFEDLTLEEHIKYYEKSLESFYKPKCIYNSFRKVESNIIVTTYPYVFNEYLNMIAFKEVEPDVLILDESHNLLGSIITPFRTSFKTILEKSFGKRNEQNELFKIIKNEIEIIGNIIKVSEDIDYVLNAFKSICNSIMDLIEKNIKETIGILDKKRIPKILEEIDFKEALIEPSVIYSIFKDHEDAINLLLDWFDILKAKMVKKEISGSVYRKKWRFRTLLKMYFLSENKDLVFVQKGYKLEAILVDLRSLIKNYLEKYDRILLMSGTNFDQESFSKIFGINRDKIEYIKVNIKIGKKEAKIIWNYTSKYEYRRDTKNVENLIDDIKFIIKNCEKYQLFMFPSSGYMLFIYKKLPDDIKEKILLDTGEISLKSILKTKKEVIFTYARSRFVEGIELVKNGKSLLRTIVIVGIPYPPPPNASPLTKKILEVNKINYKDYSEIIKTIQIKQVIGRAIRNFDDKVTIFFIDSRYRKADIKKYL